MEQHLKSIEASITKYEGLSYSSTTKVYFLTILEAAKSKYKVPVNMTSDEGSRQLYDFLNLKLLLLIVLLLVLLVVGCVCVCLG